MKIIKIENCIKCHYSYNEYGKHYCTWCTKEPKDKDLYNRTGNKDVAEVNDKSFPDWCPLDDKYNETPNVHCRCIKDYLIRTDLIFKVGETYGYDYKIGKKHNAFYVNDENDEVFKFYEIDDFYDYFELV